MDTIIKVKNIKNDVWSQDRIMRLVNYLYITNTKVIYTTVFCNVLFTKKIYAILNELFPCNNEVILRVYWEELKQFRLQLKHEYDKALLCISNNMSNTMLTNNIVDIFTKHDIPVNDTDILSSIDNYIMNNKVQEDIQCKICYDKNVSYIISHSEHVCTICKDCVQKIDLSKKCPFCKIEIEHIKKLFIR